MRITLIEIARACHTANKALCESQGDLTQPEWGEAPEWQQTSAVNGVALHVTDPNMSPQSSHESWLAQKTAEGWKYGAVKNTEAKEHPCFLPYDELPPAQKAKDYIFKAIVSLFAPYLGDGERSRAAVKAMEFHAAMATLRVPEEPAKNTENPTTSSPPTDVTLQATDLSNASPDPANSEQATAGQAGSSSTTNGSNAPSDGAETAAETPPVANEPASA